MFAIYYRFKAEISKVFREINKKRVAERKFLLLRQTDSINIYILKFQQLSFRLEWYNKILAANYYFKLKDVVKNEFCPK